VPTHRRELGSIEAGAVARRILARLAATHSVAIRGRFESFAAAFPPRESRRHFFARSAGLIQADLYEAVRLTIQGRTCTMDVIEVPDNVPVLIGQIPLEHLDLVIDTRSRTLIGNPAHGGEHMYELY